MASGDKQESASSLRGFTPRFFSIVLIGGWNSKKDSMKARYETDEMRANAPED